MTIQDAILRANQQKPNLIPQSTKIEWLNTVEGQIYNEIIKTHELPDEVTFSGYDSNTDGSTILLIGSPYDDVYVNWLLCQIDLVNGETTKYNNSKTLFNNALMTARDFYNRMYAPVRQVKAWGFGGGRRGIST